MARGTGDSFGGALVAALADAAGGTFGIRKSYTAKGWHAQISKLTSSDRGYIAAEKAGLSVNRRTLLDWLTERREPSAANQKKIAEAYALMRGQWPAEVERRLIEIRGLVKLGNDERERGRGCAPLVVDGSTGAWHRMKGYWADGHDDPGDWQDAFVEDVLEADLGEGSEPWEFPGSSYAVSW